MISENKIKESKQMIINLSEDVKKIKFMRLIGLAVVAVANIVSPLSLSLVSVGIATGLYVLTNKMIKEKEALIEKNNILKTIKESVSNVYLSNSGDDEVVLANYVLQKVISIEDQSEFNPNVLDNDKNEVYRGQIFSLKNSEKYQELKNKLKVVNVKNYFNYLSKKDMINDSFLSKLSTYGISVEDLKKDNNLSLKELYINTKSVNNLLSKTNYFSLLEQIDLIEKENLNEEQKSKINDLKIDLKEIDKLVEKLEKTSEQADNVKKLNQIIDNCIKIVYIINDELEMNLNKEIKSLDNHINKKASLKM